MNTDLRMYSQIISECKMADYIFTGFFKHMNMVSPVIAAFSEIPAAHNPIFSKAFVIQFNHSRLITIYSFDVLHNRHDINDRFSFQSRDRGAADMITSTNSSFNTASSFSFSSSNLRGHSLL